MTGPGRRAIMTSMTAPLIKPPALSVGDTVAVICLSFGAAAALPGRFGRGVAALEQTFGFTIVETPHCTRDPGWLLDHPEARAADLHWALENPEVAGVISVIGGDDSIRLLPHLDLDLIARHPKVFTGYSDTTIQHLVHRAAGVGSFYGFALMTEAAENGGIHDFTEQSFRRTVMSNAPVGSLTAAPDWTEERLDWRDDALATRRRRLVPNYGWLWYAEAASPVQGPLIGGCLEVLDMARGTDIWPPLEAFDGAVLHLEISEEKPPVDQVGHWIRSFTAMGITERVAAVLFSRPEDFSLRQTLMLYDTVRTELDRAGRTDLPLVGNFDYGHSSPTGLLPLGRTARVDPNAQTIEILESAVV